MFKESPQGGLCLGEFKVKSGLIGNVNKVDLQIINLLQEDCRLSFNKIASKLGISVGTAFNHVKNLEKKGILKKYTIIIDSPKLGYSVTAIIFLQVDGGHVVDVENKIANIANVIAVYNVTGDYDAIMITKFKNSADLNTFIKALLATPHVRRTVTNFTLNIIKEDFRIKL